MKILALFLSLLSSGVFAEPTYLENYRRFDVGEAIGRLWPSAKVCRQRVLLAATKQDEFGRRHFRFNIGEALPPGVEWYEPSKRMNREIYAAFESWIEAGNHEPHVKLKPNPLGLFAAGFQFFATKNGIKRIVRGIARRELPFDLLVHVEPGFGIAVSPVSSN